MLPLLSYQKLTNHIDGTTAPSATITSGDQSIPNPAFTTWNDFDQRAVILLNSSLTEEAAAEVLGLTTAHANLDCFRDLDCLQTATLFEKDPFSVTKTALATFPWTCYPQAKSEDVLKSLHGSATPPAAFFSQQSSSRSSLEDVNNANKTLLKGGRASNSNGGRGRGGRRPPHCQLCRTNGHYASSCPSLHTYASNAATSDANLAQAFTSQCHVTQGHTQIDTPMALAATVGVSRKASFELWHNHLGHDPPISDARFLNLAHQYKALTLRAVGAVPRSKQLLQEPNMTSLNAFITYSSEEDNTPTTVIMSLLIVHLPVPIRQTAPYRAYSSWFYSNSGLDIPHVHIPVVKASTNVRIVLSLLYSIVRRPTSVRCQKCVFTWNTLMNVFVPWSNTSRSRNFPYFELSLKNSCIMYLLVVCLMTNPTGNNESLLTSVTTLINQEFCHKRPLSDLSIYIGLEVSYTNDGLFLSQAKYATDVLTRAALLDSKPVSTPLAANEVFVTGDLLFAIYSFIDLSGSFAIPHHH
ncbi:zinc finger, CCHC-type containing LTR copia-type gag-polypeptide [Tanacetum coccineum]